MAKFGLFVFTTLRLDPFSHLSCAPKYPLFAMSIKKHTQLHHAGIVIGRANRQGYNQRDGMGTQEQ